MTAAEAARSVCDSLTGEVGRIAPPGIGHWDPAFEMTADADVEFVTALLAWERNPTPEGRARVRAAYNAVLDAWREAARQFTQRGSDKTTPAKPEQLEENFEDRGPRTTG